MIRKPPKIEEKKCPNCSAAMKATANICPECRHVQWNNVLITGAFGLAFLVLAVFLSPRITLDLLAWSVRCIFGALAFIMLLAFLLDIVASRNRRALNITIIAGVLISLVLILFYVTGSSLVYSTSFPTETPPQTSLGDSLSCDLVRSSPNPTSPTYS
jgi:uncharacterized membrane protein YfcA